MKNENGLIPIQENNGNKSVDARELHKFLKVGRVFSSWIKGRIKKYEFVENIDYIPYVFDTNGNLLSIKLTKSGEFDTQPVRVEYEISISMAKELAILENNQQGRKARKYFIGIEEKWHQIMQPIGGISPIIHNGKVGIPRKELLIASGYSYTSGMVNKLKQLWPDDHFMLCRTACVSPEFAKLRFEQGKVRQLEIDFRETRKRKGLKGGKDV